jgi:hypothetical protein
MKENLEILEWECETCGKLIRSLYEKQLQANAEQHMLKHKLASQNQQEETAQTEPEPEQPKQLIEKPHKVNINEESKTFECQPVIQNRDE